MQRLPDERPFQPAIIGARALARSRLATDGLSRRALLRRSLGGAAALWLATFAGALLHGVWPSGAKATGKIRVGTLDELVGANPGLPIRDGYPAYVPAAKAFVILIDPELQSFVPGRDDKGDGTTVNVRALSQVCPHLGCRPNPCIDDFWMHCPCHQSRYDRLGIKAEGTLYGPAPRSMDRFAVEVDDQGALTIDTSTITRGPQPIRLGSPGLEPPRAPSGCT